MSRFVTELLPAFLTSGLFALYINKLHRFVSVIAKRLQKNEGIWLSSGWLWFTIVTLAICCITVILWALYK